MWPFRRRGEDIKADTIELTAEEQEECRAMTRSVTQNEQGTIYMREEEAEAFKRQIAALCLTGRAERFLTLSDSRPEYKKEAHEAAAKACRICPISIYFYDLACVLDAIGKKSEARTTFREFLRRLETERLGPVEQSFMHQRDIDSAVQRAKKATLTTSASLPIEDLHLDMPIESLSRLTEFSETEYSLFGRRFEGEKDFHAPCASLADQQWKVDVGTVQGKVYKIAMYFESECKKTVIDVSADLMKFCQQHLGRPSQQDEAVYTWDAADGNVVMQLGKVGTTYTISLFETSRAVRTFAPKS